MEPVTREISSLRAVLGIIRETIFLKPDFRFTAGAQQWTARLVDVRENSRRDRTEERSLRFLVTSGVVPAGSARFEVSLSDFVAIGELTCRPETVSESFTTNTPSVLTVRNARRHRRVQATLNWPRRFVQLRSQRANFPVLFQMTNHSLTGIGGRLRLPVGQHVEVGDELRGVLDCQEATIHLRGTIRHVRDIGLVEPGWWEHAVGLQLAVVEPMRPVTDPSPGFVEVQSPMTPNWNGRFVVESENERAVTIRAPKGSWPSLPIGATLASQGNAPLMVSAFDGTLIELSRQPSSEPSWATCATAGRLAEFAERPSSKHELLRVAAEAGAVSAEYLRIQELGDDDSFDEARGMQPWCIRAVDHDNSGQIRGYCAAAAVGDNAWFMADLVGASEEHRRVSPNFAGAFLDLVGRQCAGMSPAPKHLYLWTPHHKYWASLRSRLNEDRKLKIASGTFAYSRWSPHLVGESRLDTVRLDASEYARIEGVREALARTGTLALASALDFDVDRFGSPRLRRLTQEAHQPLRREYALISGSASSWLAIASRMPPGTFIGRQFDSVFLFQLDGASSLDDEEWKQVALAATRFALEHVGAPSAIRRIGAHSDATLQSGETDLMEWVLCHPLASTIIKQYLPERT